jgi:hypothetical protein
LSNLPKKQVIHILKYWKYIGRTTKQSVLSDKQLQLMVSILKSDFCQIEPKWFYFVFEQKKNLSKVFNFCFGDPMPKSFSKTKSIFERRLR